MHILHLEDSPNDAELIQRALRREWPECAVKQVATAEEYAAAVAAGGFDLILSDYSIPGFDGLTALAHARQRCPGVPFLFLSGMIGEERAVDALKRGAADYILKDRPARLVPAIRQALAFVDETRRRRRSEEALRENEDRFRLITENIAEHIDVVDLAGRRTYSNRSGRELLGAAAAQPGTIWFDTIDFDDLARVRRTFDRIVETGTSEAFEYRLCLGPKVRHIEAHGAVLRDSTGTVTSVILVCRDVTGRRESETRLRDQASLLDKARDAIVAMDLDRRVTYWNASAERLYGLKAMDVLGHKLDELGLGYDPNRFAIARTTALERGEWRGEFRLHSCTGTAVTVESTWSLVMENDGRPRSILAIDTDVTERKKLEAQLLRAQRLESIGTLAGGVAHDLNNVLTPILCTIDLLKMHVNDPQDRQLIEKTRASAHHGAALVRELLAFARGADGERTRIDPATALANLEPLIRQALPDQIEVAVQHRQPAWPIEANATQFSQVIINLALNARDAMPSGGRLEITTERATVDATLAAANPGTQPGRFLCISVRDTGTGIAPDILERIFDPFFTTKSAGKGTGLGLSIIAGIMKSHRGFVQVDSEPGRGTTFHLYFPALPAPRPDVRANPAALARGEGEGVLLVDDEPAVRETLRTLLHRAGYLVFTAADVTSALREFERRKTEIALVITDMMLPDGSGVDIVKTVRAKSPVLPIIAISGMMASGNYDELLHLSPPVECLSKPLPPRVLLDAAHRALHAVPVA
jgi:two-component system, cell cycle sensor histidine kinase and response regulator CckA